MDAGRIYYCHLHNIARVFIDIACNLSTAKTVAVLRSDAFTSRASLISSPYCATSLRLRYCLLQHIRQMCWYCADLCTTICHYMSEWKTPWQGTVP
ncbi:hypothetical protein OSTOST_22888 [Ostertagia ostertagi]